jgi:hypothetical protein
MVFCSPYRKVGPKGHLFMRGSLSPERASALGKIGSRVSHSRHDLTELTANARQAFRDSFERQVDPDHLLEPDERARRAEALRKAHYYRMALKSAEVRSAQKAAS